MTSAPVRPWDWQDTEVVTCCVCDVPGLPVYDFAPFGVVRCPRCTLVFVSPRLRADALQRLYDCADYHAGVYGAPGRFSPAMWLQRAWTAGRLALAAQESPRSGGRLLEVGSGHGFFLDAARSAGHQVTGVELSATAAAYARDTLGLRVHSTQLADAPLDGPFDVICAWDTIEHVPDPVEFWSAVRAVLADDGVVLFSTPCISSLPARLLRQRWWTLKPAEHIWDFTPRTHRSVAAAAGMRVTRVIGTPFARANLARVDSLVGIARPA